MPSTQDPLLALNHQLDALRRADLAGRPVVLVVPVLAAATAPVERALQDSAARVLVVTWGDGTGALPDPASARVHRMPPMAATSVVDELRAWGAAIEHPDADLVRAVEEFDPARTAAVILHLPLAADAFCGRPTYGARPVRQERLEDKARSRELWRAAAVPHAPEEVVPADLTAARAAAARLDRGAGTVWSADASAGINGGGALVRHVTDDGAGAYAALAPHAERLRLMPFLDGVPCSIHGQVADDGVLVLRPVELVMLRPAGGDRFVQAGISSWWDPAPDDRERMRDTARAVGAHLGRHHGYRGSFGIDGILTAEGFRPNELNPRHSGGISNLGKGLRTLSLAEVHRRLLLDGRLPVPVAELEPALLAACDAHRFGYAGAPTSSRTVRSSVSVSVAGRPAPSATSTDEVRGALEPTEDPARATGLLQLGPAAMGALVRLTPLALTPGERLAPWALAAYELADRLWGTRFGPLAAAPDVTGPRPRA